MEFYKILKQYMKDRNISQKTLSIMTNLSTSQISELLNNKYKPGYDTIKQIANALNVSTDYLFGLENEDYTKTYSNEKTTILNEDDSYILSLYKSLNADGKEIARHYLENLQQINSIKKSM